MTTDLETTTDALIASYLNTRRFTEEIVSSLSPEDCMVQSMDDVSPTRWHLAHTTWFFETFLLADQPDYELFDPQFQYLFNSYYNSLGAQFPRAKRGTISRPGLHTIRDYRNRVDEQVVNRLRDTDFSNAVAPLLSVGIQHEQQHQELILTDIKHVLACNPLLPAYSDNPLAEVSPTRNQWQTISEGVFLVGYQGDGFHFDNETPRHNVYLDSCQIASDLVTCGEYLEFIEDGGYRKPELWLSLGWDTVEAQGWEAPLYWLKKNDQWHQFTLAGLVPVQSQWPVCHVSLFEADAFARWSGHRLPTEFEWETASHEAEIQSPANSLDTRTSQSGPTGVSQSPCFADTLVKQNLAIHPTRSPDGFMGSVWQWTRSDYAPYPGYHPPDGAIGEYNGKFMCNQHVLRGGSVATSSRHIRPTYRNFFPAATRWQFSGIRLAR